MFKKVYSMIGIMSNCSIKESNKKETILSLKKLVYKLWFLKNIPIRSHRRKYIKDIATLWHDTFISTFPSTSTLSFITGGCLYNLYLPMQCREKSLSQGLVNFFHQWLSIWCEVAVFLFIKYHQQFIFVLLFLCTKSINQLTNSTYTA